MARKAKIKSGNGKLSFKDKLKMINKEMKKQTYMMKAFEKGTKGEQIEKN